LENFEAGGLTAILFSDHLFELGNNCLRVSLNQVKTIPELISRGDIKLVVIVVLLLKKRRKKRRESLK